MHSHERLLVQYLTGGTGLLLVTSAASSFYFQLLFHWPGVLF